MSYSKKIDGKDIVLMRHGNTVTVDFSCKRTISDKPSHVVQEEIDMSNISKTELEALLRANKSEVDVVAAEMKTDIAEFKAFQAQQFSNLNSTLGEIKGQISNANAETTAIKGQLEGMKAVFSTIQWMVGTILVLVAIIMALPQVQGYFKSAEQPAPMQQPTVIYVQQPASPVQPPVAPAPQAPKQ